MRAASGSNLIGNGPCISPDTARWGTWLVAAGALAARSLEGLGIRLRVRGSSVSRKPVSRNSPASPMRHEIPRVGSAIENTTVQPPLWRENIAIGALTLSPAGGTRGNDTGGQA